MNDSDDYSDIDCEHVLSGAAARVLMAAKVVSEFMEVETRKQSQLLSRMKLWADGIPPSKEQFNGNEGRCGGANDRMLVAFKTNKVRLYGFVRHYRGVKTVIIVDIDAAKKQDKASPRILRRAKEAAVLFDGKCGD
ncbi:hypothetical protein [Novosphingobium kaempferiae]|uniref:hypothetical protein n=1 Tax=Novosphingobium kaempferiae TaxID=2896849 RepID=UPI001E489F64|nr:hypothetical protein [Novosphingobium kaempferiae]